MRRRNACLIGLTLTLLYAASAGGQEPASKSLSTTLPGKQKWARFVVVRGRVMVFITRGQGAAAWTEESPGGVGETFGVHYQPGTLLVRYDVSAPDQHLIIQFHGPRHLTIDRKPAAHSDLAPLSYEQRESGMVRMTLGEGDQRQQWEAPSLWHLMLIQREATREHLIPILQILRPDWRLAERADQIERRLLDDPHDAARPSWDLLVRQLADPSFAVRQSADRQLRAAGQSVLPFLESLDQTRLNAEQSQRVKQLCKTLSSDTEDVPHRVAVWLAGDARLWTALTDGKPSEQLGALARHRLQSPTEAAATAASNLAQAENETQP